jgi:hypothetical protein
MIRGAALDDAEALDHVQLLGMRRAEGIDEGLGVQPDRVDDERIAVLVLPIDSPNQDDFTPGE